MTEDQIKHMVDRFLAWKLPENLSPDGGISFEKYSNKGTPYEHKFAPSGTNFLDATQAAAMVRYMVEGMPGNERWIADLGKFDLSERQPDNSYRVTYKMVPVDAVSQVEKDIAYFEGAARDTPNNRLALVAFGISAGLKMAKN